MNFRFPVYSVNVTLNNKMLAKSTTTWLRKELTLHRRGRIYGSAPNSTSTHQRRLPRLLWTRATQGFSPSNENPPPPTPVPPPTKSQFHFHRWSRRLHSPSLWSQRDYASDGVVWTGTQHRLIRTSNTSNLMSINVDTRPSVKSRHVSLAMGPTGQKTVSAPTLNKSLCFLRKLSQL